jgi:hypothetical protein
VARLWPEIAPCRSKDRLAFSYRWGLPVDILLNSRIEEWEVARKGARPRMREGWSLQAKPGLFPYERVHFSQGTQIADELVSRFRQVHTG